MYTKKQHEAIIAFAARHYGWSHSRVGGDITYNGEVFVGSNYAGTIRDGKLRLDRRVRDSYPLIVDLTEIYTHDTEDDHE